MTNSGTALRSVILMSLKSGPTDTPGSFIVLIRKKQQDIQVGESDTPIFYLSTYVHISSVTLEKSNYPSGKTILSHSLSFSLYSGGPCVTPTIITLPFLRSVALSLTMPLSITNYHNRNHASESLSVLRDAFQNMAHVSTFVQQFVIKQERNSKGNRVRTESAQVVSRYFPVVVTAAIQSRISGDIPNAPSFSRYISLRF